MLVKKKILKKRCQKCTNSKCVPHIWGEGDCCECRVQFSIGSLERKRAMHVCVHISSRQMRVRTRASLHTMKKGGGWVVEWSGVWAIHKCVEYTSVAKHQQHKDWIVLSRALVRLVGRRCALVRVVRACVTEMWVHCQALRRVLRACNVPIWMNTSTRIVHKYLYICIKNMCVRPSTHSSFWRRICECVCAFCNAFTLCSRCDDKLTTTRHFAMFRNESGAVSVLCTQSITSTAILAMFVISWYICYKSQNEYAQCIRTSLLKK